MLLNAIEAKKREMVAAGSDYSRRELARDSKVSHTYVSLVVNGERQPSREVVKAWSRALFPYLPEDEALMAAGYLPEDIRKVNLFRRAGRLVGDAWTEFEERVGEAVSDLTTEQREQLRRERAADRKAKSGRRTTRENDETSTDSQSSPERT